MALIGAPPVFKPSFIGIVLDIGIAPGTGGPVEGDVAGELLSVRAGGLEDCGALEPVGIGVEDGLAVGPGDIVIPDIGPIVISGIGGEVEEGHGEAARALPEKTASVAAKVINTSDRRSTFNRSGGRRGIYYAL